MLLTVIVLLWPLLVATGVTLSQPDFIHDGAVTVDEPTAINGGAGAGTDSRDADTDGSPCSSHGNSSGCTSVPLTDTVRPVP